MSESITTGLDQLITSLRRGDYGRDETPLDPTEIKAIRKKSGLQRQEFCDWIGISVNTLKSWECGRRKPSRIASRVLKSYQRSLEQA